LSRHASPDFSKNGAGHKVVSLCHSPVKVVHIEWLNAIAPRAAVLLRTNGLQAHLATAEAGDAMAALPRVMGDRRPGLVRLSAPLPEPSQPVKIGVHPDLRDTPRIRALIDFLVYELKISASELNPGQ